MPTITKLTRNEFEQSLNAFVETSHRVALADQWQLKKDRFGKQVYITKKQTIVCQTSSRQAECSTDFEICDDVPDIAELELASPDAGIICTEYHIVYSTTYCVPVLYFNAYFSDGSFLSRNDLEQHVFSKLHVEALRTNSLIQQGAISQHDHPILGQPFFYVHPCDTSALMAQLQIENALSYIISWLSFFGPPVGLYIDPIYVQKDWVKIG